LAELNASTSLLPLGKAPSTLSHSQRRATSIKNGRLQYRGGGSGAGLFKASQVALVEEQLTVTFVDRSQPEIVVPLRKKTVVRQAPNGGDGEFLVDKHCFKGSALEMHDWIDAISTVAQRSKNRRSGTVEPGAADHDTVDATDSDDGDDDSSSSSASGTRRRKNQVTRRRQVHGSIAEAAAADDGVPKGRGGGGGGGGGGGDKRRSLTHSQATILDGGNDDHDDHGPPGTPDDDGSSSSSSTMPRTTRAKLKKRESEGADLLLLEATLHLKVSKKSWKPRRAVLTSRHLTLYDGSATTPSERYALQFGSVSVQAQHAGGFSGTSPIATVSGGAGSSGTTTVSSFAGTAALPTTTNNDDEGDRRWVLLFAAEGKRIELAAADEKTVQQWADAIASACDDLRTRSASDSVAATHRFDKAADGSLSMSSRLRLHHDDAATSGTSGANDDGGDGRSSSEPRVLREGWLHRKGETIMFGSAYKKKWAVLDTMLLRFYDSEKDARKSGAIPMATIQLAFASVKLATDKKSGESKYHFDIYSGQKRHELYAETEASRSEWRDAIQDVASALITAAAAGGDKRDPVFGVPLALVMDEQRDTHGSLAIPYAVHRLLQAFKSHNGAKTERIFRVEPDAAALAQYRLAFEEHRFEAEPADAHVAAALLKAYLAELPSPLMNKRVSDNVFDVVSLGFNDGDAALQRVIGVVERMEEPSRSVLVALVEVLGEVCHPDRVEYSKMRADKLADVFTPILVGSRFYDKLHDDDDRVETFLRALIGGARTLTRRLGVAEAATESAPASYLRGINGRPVVHEGWLMKRGRLRTKKRWVILDERALYIFDAPEEKWPPKETLDLAGATAVAVEGSRTRFSFRAAGNAKEGETEFEASSGQELEMWLSAVQWKIKLSSGERAPAADVSKVTHADAKEALACARQRGVLRLLDAGAGALLGRQGRAAVRGVRRAAQGGDAGERDQVAAGAAERLVATRYSDAQVYRQRKSERPLRGEFGRESATDAARRVVRATQVGGASICNVRRSTGNIGSSGTGGAVASAFGEVDAGRDVCSTGGAGARQARGSR
jgi:hypothetical protein